MNKHTRQIFLFFALFMLYSAGSFAEENAEGKKIDFSINLFVMNAPNTASFSYISESDNLSPSGVEIKMSVSLENHLKYSLGIASASQNYGAHKSGFLWVTAWDEFSSVKVSTAFIELLYSFELVVEAEQNIGIRISYVDMTRTAGITHDDPYIADHFQSLSGQGYEISFPIEIKRRWNDLTFNFSYIPGIWNVPLAGTEDNLPVSHSFTGGTSTLMFGITL
ncbi:hypothetical protein A2276_00650 [candidate division WOR-1 bacterium RIFOXYA12_FULL_43_27]|uniref:Uncharacterized protein n=1 Tax=candidate division WOR-1 bacterium RIFOXYC2_FULL_46_14 TaxID=1802587 RepID=A0A1F4U4H4_UNCSA|nr:MAG: hypothetical protein A2276_00650 [candidate division WOR-1 bacterium RIFOXYA12_FULL_43_27]OGC20800.1 MAG: hypothetical protein A2292_07225 [candidate division WOR-1 bacterium RIFOXYB2_FULL_46_45]OGC31463.1 MAG: hypothetical protein A2232_04225 [candidate division WOR-1 bacterium RIFOXYA2_FULL_46_56]OGC39868.1 MAG: hypothetical protein A2438_05060 [candidate division WOR-1 bacterium RIFOXYC2_FULL_46_14]